MIEVTALDGIGDFIGFLEGVRDDGRVGLLDVPRATELRVAQAIHQVQQIFKAEHQSLSSQDFPVGAGLLAKAVCQTTLMSTDKHSSRASPLPHWIGADFTVCDYAGFR
ncbi:hypothetical protein D3C76_1596210 [compost metagenome]